MSQFAVTHVLLGENGLTSSEANHLCNVAKELVEAGDRRLQKMTTLTRTIKGAGGEDTKYQKANFDFTQAMTIINQRARFYPLVAVLREAIKARENLFAGLEASVMPQPPLAEPLPAVEPPIPRPKPVLPTAPTDPVLLPDVTDAWGRDQLNIKQFGEMLAAEAAAAAFGHYLHNEGELDRMQAESEVAALGDYKGHVVITEFTSNEEVEKAFMQAQAYHRTHEQKLNMYRSMIHEFVNKENQRRREANQVTVTAHAKAISDHHHECQRLNEEWRASNVEANQAYADAQQARNEKQKALDDAWQLEFKTAQEKFEADRKVARQQVAALKIIVPEALQPVMDELKKAASGK